MSLFYQKQITEVFKLLDTTNKGLSSEEADDRLQKVGSNRLPEKKGKHILLKFIEQFNDFLIIILWVAAFLSFLFGEVVDSVAIIVIVIVNALIGFIQEYKADRAVEALKKNEVQKTRVLRDGRLKTIEVVNLVPGDVLLLEAGDKVPADARIIEAYEVKVDEALLTGESVPGEKHAEPIAKEVALADQRNMLFRDTKVTEGKAYAVVVQTGAETEVGKIALLLGETKEEETPLQKELEKAGKSITYMILVISLLVFAILMYKKEPFIDSFLTAISLAVAAIPEGLPAIVAVVLSVGMLILAKKNVIVKKLKAVETLGAVKYLLTDKTGTLTWNKINLVRLFTAHGDYRVKGEGYQTKGTFQTSQGKSLTEADIKNLAFVMESMVVCNNAELDFDEGTVSVIGDTTEGALLVAAERFGMPYSKLRESYELIVEKPFSSATKYMAVIVRHKKTKKTHLIIKGAPEVLLPLSVASPVKKDAEKLLTEWAKQGLRNLAIGYKELSTTHKDIDKELKNIHFLGLIGEEDTVRVEAIEAVEKGKLAGIETIMITGDHRLAALAISQQVGIAEVEEQIIDGSELDGINDEVLIEKLFKKIHPVRVFSRVSPQQKLRIVNLVKKHTGEVIAVTGDGVNDSPSLKSAHVGVVMGQTGSDVAKEVADVIIKDDNYASIIAGIFQGRVIFDNLVKFIRYLLSCNIGEIVVVFFGTLFGYSHILLPTQLLFINVVTDSLPALALGFEKGTANMMSRPPRSTKDSLLNKRRVFFIGLEGTVIGLLSLAAFFVFLPRGFEYARTGAFLVLITAQLFHALNNRSEDEQLFNLPFFANKLLLFAIVFSFILTVTATQIPLLESVFQTVHISAWQDWAVIGLISSGIILFTELKKYVVRKFGV